MDNAKYEFRTFGPGGGGGASGGHGGAVVGLGRAIADIYIVTEDGTLAMSAAKGVLANDVNGASLTAVLASGPSYASLTLNPDGSFIYTPQANFAGGDSFSYRVTDGFAMSDLVTVAIGVAPVNDAPAGAPTAVLARGFQDMPYTVAAATLLAGFSDVDNDRLRVTNLAADHGAVASNASGSFTITPAAGYSGPVALTYKVTDGAIGLAASLSYAIDPLSGAPTKLTLTGATVAENALNGTLVGAVSAQGDGGALVYSLLDDAGGRFAIDGATGALTVANGLLLDYETDIQHQLRVRARDGAFTTDTLFTVTLTNVVETQVKTLTAGNDLFVAPSADIWVINAAAGDDQITTLGGGDVVRGNAGNDILSTGGGDDTITFSGLGDGFDTVDGGAGFDKIVALTNGTVIGLKSLANIELISANGCAGVVVRGSADANVLDFTGVALLGVDRIDAAAGNDRVVGSGGDDLIVGGTGDDDLSGGGGADRFLVSGGQAGVDRVDGGAGFDRILAVASNTVIGLSALSGVEAIDANGFAGVRIVGSALADVLDFSGVALTGIGSIDGGAGNDELTGSAGGDTIIGGAGDDVLRGGGGNDTFIIGARAGIDRIDGGGDFDTIRVAGGVAAFTWANISNVEAFTGAAVRLIGSAGDDLLDFTGIALTGVSKIDAGDGVDTVVGSSGADVIGFSLGRDTLAGGAGADIFDLDGIAESRPGGLADFVTDFTQGLDRVSLTDVDASTALPGNQGFSFIGAGGFTGSAGQLRYDHTAATTSVYGDVDGDSVADFQIDFMGMIRFQASDFNL